MLFLSSFTKLHTIPTFAVFKLLELGTFTVLVRCESVTSEEFRTLVPLYRPIPPKPKAQL